jgi:hypothetical protein
MTSRLTFQPTYLGFPIPKHLVLAGLAQPADKVFIVAPLIPEACNLIPARYTNTLLNTFCAFG